MANWNAEEVRKMYSSHKSVSHNEGVRQVGGPRPGDRADTTLHPIWVEAFERQQSSTDREAETGLKLGPKYLKHPHFRRW